MAHVRASSAIYPYCSTLLSSKRKSPSQNEKGLYFFSFFVAVTFKSRLNYFRRTLKVSPYHEGYGYRIPLPRCLLYYCHLSRKLYAATRHLVEVGAAREIVRVNLDRESTRLELLVQNILYNMP